MTTATIHVGTIGETLPPVARKDGETAPTCDPRCLKEDCDGSLRDTGRTRSTASAGILVDLQCTVCTEHSWWRLKTAYELVSQALSF